MTKRLVISSNDFGLFDAELNSYEYEYFSKHIGAFKRFMQEEPKEQRELFLNAFCEYSYNHVEIKAMATMSDPKRKFIESFRQYALETFINGKFSAAKQFLNDSVIVARNKHMIQYMDSHSYAKDPFFHKDTRDCFRRLFGEPTEAGTCVKVICVLPLYVRFAGSICRYLKRWLDMEESLHPMPVKSGKKTKAEKKAMKEQAIAAANAAKAAAAAQAKPSKQITTSKTVSQQGSSAVGGSKTSAVDSNGATATAVNGDQSKAIVPKDNSKPAQPDSDDFSNYYGLYERKQRKRDFRKKGKKQEPIACQHPCHGKPCNCNPYKHNHHTHDHHTHDHHSHDHSHDHQHHHHDHNYDPPSREELMSCLCTKHKAMAEAKIAEKRAALEKRLENEAKNSDDKTSEDDKNSDEKNPANDAKSSEDKSSEGGSPGIDSPEKNISEDGNSKEKDDLCVKENNSENKSSEDNKTDDTNSEDKTCGAKDSSSNDPEDKISDVKKPEDKSSEDKNSDDIASNTSKSSEYSPVKGADVISPTQKKSKKIILENGLISSDEEEMWDAAVERFVRRTFPELHLGEPHPNEQYKQIKAEEKRMNEEKKAKKNVKENELPKKESKEESGKNGTEKETEEVGKTEDKLEETGEQEETDEKGLNEVNETEEMTKEKLKETEDEEKMKDIKLRTCAFCREQEWEVKTFKKCQRCKGKGTKFYCSRECQKRDWATHRLEHTE